MQKQNSSLEEQAQNSQRYKVILLGDYGVGKTTFFKTIMTKRYPVPQSEEEKISTNSISLTMDTIKSPAPLKISFENMPFVFEVWDTDNQEKYSKLPSVYYKNVAVVIYLFDITNRKSFEGVLDWIENFEAVNDENDVVSVVLGNKDDRKNEREVNPDEVSEVLKGMDIIEYITATDINTIGPVLVNICNLLLDDKKPSEADDYPKDITFWDKKKHQIERNCFYQ